MKNFKLQNLSVNYHVNEEKQTITAICKTRVYKWNTGYNSYEPVKNITSVGIASPKNGDKFDIEIGKKVARAIAEKKAYSKLLGIVKIYYRILVKETESVEQNMLDINDLIEHQKEYISKF